MVDFGDRETWVELDDAVDPTGAPVERAEPAAAAPEIQADSQPRPNARLVLLGERARLERELLWCMTHRAVRVARSTVVCAAPARFVEPIAPARPAAGFGTLDRPEAQAFLAEFAAATVHQASGDAACEVLGVCDVVHPDGEFVRSGPYVWARIQRARYVLVEIDLWPRRSQHQDCVPRLLDRLIEPLGVLEMLQDPVLIDQAHAAVGVGTYEGVCRCEAW